MEQNLFLRARSSGQEAGRAVVNAMVGHQRSLDKSVLGMGGKEGNGNSVLNGEVKNEWQRVIWIAKHCRISLLDSSLWLVTSAS